MPAIPFTKAHGCGNDFLVIAEETAPVPLEPFVRAICDRHFGIGADGVYLVQRFSGHASIRLFNSDGSSAELSGNGTRCVAATLVDDPGATDVLHLQTGAGV